MIKNNKQTRDPANAIKGLPALRNRSGQEEMFGFAVIAIIISIGILILISFMIKGPSQESTENYQIESFIQASLQYTTDCESEVDFLSLQQLVIACGNVERCLDERDSCDVLNSTLANLADKGWNVGENSSIKGYDFKVFIEEQEKLSITKGNKTINFRGGFQDFTRSGKDYEVSLNVYS